MNNIIRTLIIGFSNCGKKLSNEPYSTSKEEPFFTNTKSLNRSPSIKAHTSDEIQPLGIYEKNSTFVFDDMLLSKQKSNIVLLFTCARHNNTEIYYKSQHYFQFPKKLRNISNINNLFKQTLRYIIPLFRDIAGLGMDLEERKELCRKAWEIDFDYLQIDRFAKIAECRYTIRDCNKSTYMECTPGTKTL